MPVIDTLGDIAVYEIERISPLLGKMLGAALGGSIGLGGFKYFEPHRTGKGFDRSKDAARRTGITVGRSIAGGNVERVHQTRGLTSQPQNAIGTNRFYKKHRSVQHTGCNCKHCHYDPCNRSKP